MNYEGGSSYGRAGGYGYGGGGNGGGGNASGRYGGTGAGYRGGHGGGRDAGTSGPGGTGKAVALGAHDSGYRIGQTVSHARFGVGVITGLEGSGDDARAQIHFKRDGAKWLLLSVAKLDPV
jgi:DNA helicase II / ATP-dependent DNA helicase PcrA